MLGTLAVARGQRVVECDSSSSDAKGREVERRRLSKDKRCCKSRNGVAEEASDGQSGMEEEFRGE